MPHIFKQSTFFAFFIFAYIISANPLFATAQTIDQRCITNSQCNEQRSRFVFGTDEQANAGLFQSEETALKCALYAQDHPGEEVGYCLAGGDIKTTFSFFGKNSFVSIGDFIKHIYSISIYVAMVLATIVLVISGIQRMTAAGNSSVVGDSNKRIIGAFSGLALLAVSYTLLNLVNPALVNLQPPEVFMVNSVGIDAPVAEELCDPDNDGPFGSCPAGKYCMPTAGMSLEESLDGPCDILAVAAVAVPTIVLGGASIATATLVGSQSITFSQFLSTAVTQSALRLGTYIPIINGTPITVGTFVSMGGTIVKTAWIGGKVVAGAGLLYAGDQLTGASSAVTDAASRFASAKGICQPTSNGLRAGDICNSGPNAGVTCGNGLRCIADASLNASLGCWGPSATGFCSSGNNGAICNEDADCSENFWCLEKNWGGTIGRRKACTDGTEGAYCDPLLTNSEGVQCAAGHTCLGGLCTTFVAATEFDVCNSHAGCEDVSRNRSFCLGITEQCLYSPLDNELDDGTLGVCVKPNSTRTHAEFSAHFWSFDSTEYYDSLEGTSYTESAWHTGGLFFKIAEELSDYGKVLTFDMSACRGIQGGENFTEDEFTSRGHVTTN